MPRRKEPLELKMETVPVEENDSPELNEDPISLDQEIPEEVEEKPKSKSKPRRQRRRRKAAEPASLEAQVGAGDIAVDSSPAPTKEELPTEPTAEREVEAVAMPFAAAEVAPEPSANGSGKPDSVKQWESIQAITDHICTNLERVNGLVKELPANYGDAIQSLLKPPSPKASPLSRVAAGLSIGAAVLSVLSLSLSQSARRAILDRELGDTHAPVAQATIPRAEAPAPAAKAPIAAPSSVSASIAMAPTRSVRRSAPARRARPRRTSRKAVDRANLLGE